MWIELLMLAEAKWDLEDLFIMPKCFNQALWWVLKDLVRLKICEVCTGLFFFVFKEFFYYNICVSMMVGKKKNWSVKISTFTVLKWNTAVDQVLRCSKEYEKMNIWPACVTDTPLILAGEGSLRCGNTWCSLTFDKSVMLAAGTS